MIRVKTASFKKSQYLFTALFFAIILNSCASLSSLDKAQDEFNKAAEIENAALLQQTIYVAGPSPSANTKYTRAYEEVNKALQKEAQLKKLDVYVDALLIKALCEWKLPKYENNNAKNSARLALDYMGENAAQDRPRDYAVLRALSALIGIEEMQEHQDKFFKASHTTEEGETEYKKVSENIKGYVDNLESISSEIGEKHEVKTYLVMCQLSALKVWSDAFDSAVILMKKNKPSQEQEQEYEEWLTEYTEWYNDNETPLLSAKFKAAGLLQEQLKDVGETMNSVYKYWDRLLVFPKEGEFENED